MANRLTQGGQVEMSDPLMQPMEPMEPRSPRGTTQPMTIVRPPERAPEPLVRPAVSAEPSYYLTRWELVNRILAITEEKTNGKAGVLQRLFTYLMVGGFAAVVNLVVFGVMLNASLPLNDQAHNIVAYCVAAELSILANFIPNDRLTFSHLPGHSRSWYARCLRFHATCFAGTILTFIIEYVLHYKFGLLALIGEAIAIVIVLFFNFTVHHLFTYAHKAEPAL